MWYAQVSRRELMDLLVTGWRPMLSELGDIGLLTPPEPSTFKAVWQGDASNAVDSFPCLIVSPELSLVSLFAALASAPQLPFPITAFSRVVTWQQLSAMRKGVKAERLAGLLNGLACLTIAEACVYAGPAVHPDGIGTSMCGRTISHAFGKALHVLTYHEIDAFFKRWVEVQGLTGAPLLNTTGIGGTLACILDVCTDVAFARMDGGVLSQIATESIQQGEPGEATWRRLTGDDLAAASLRDFESATREARGAGFQKLLDSVNASKSPPEQLIATCALVATRIAPGTLEHLNLLLKESDPRVALWYAFFAGLQRYGAALRQKQGRGVRILRDMKVEGTVSSHPRADISYDEFMVASKVEGESLSKRLTHSNEVVIELYPLVDVSFRYGRRNERNAVDGSQDSEMSRKLMADQIRSAAKSLELLAERVSGTVREERVYSRTRSGKQKRLL